MVMDSSRFDEFTKLLARNPSRRQVLKGFAATAAGGFLSSLGVERASAESGQTLSTCKPPGHPCGTSKNSTGRKGAICSQGVCVCPSGYTDCNGTCVNLSTDPSNCGACGNGCGSKSTGPNCCN